MISATTLPAASEEPPEPSTDPPRSFTTTLAPRRAKSRAWARPRPPPAPVTITSLPSKRMLMGRNSWELERGRRELWPSRSARSSRCCAAAFRPYEPPQKLRGGLFDQREQDVAPQDCRGHEKCR